MLVKASLGTAIVIKYTMCKSLIKNHRSVPGFKFYVIKECLIIMLFGLELLL